VDQEDQLLQSRLVLLLVLAEGTRGHDLVLLIYVIGGGYEPCYESFAHVMMYLLLYN